MLFSKNANQRDFLSVSEASMLTIARRRVYLD
jgi:hypothetical protein